MNDPHPELAVPPAPVSATEIPPVGEPKAAPPRPLADAAPVAGGERIASLDVLRGFALCGILIMNIQSFAMIEAAYSNPLATGEPSGPEWAAYIFSYIFAREKFMTIFAMMFGAGMALMTHNAEAKGASAFGPHYCRSLWLIVFGLAHAYLIWYGDILAPYGMCALGVYWLRRLPPSWAIALGLILIVIPWIVLQGLAEEIELLPPDQFDTQPIEWLPDTQTIEKETGVYRGDWAGQFPSRVESARQLQTWGFWFEIVWRVSGLMLIGMALLRLGVLSAQRSVAFYLALALIGIGWGAWLVVQGLRINMGSNWRYENVVFKGDPYNYWGSLPMALGYVGAVMAACRAGLFTRARAALAAIGRMALTNYLGQSVICTLIFYGHGLGMFGKVDRAAQWLFILGIWAGQIVFSQYWLRRYRFGPMEWLWRTLTYMRFQPIRLAPDAPSRGE